MMKLTLASALVAALVFGSAQANGVYGLCGVSHPILEPLEMPCSGINGACDHPKRSFAEEYGCVSVWMQDTGQGS
jgi:hypothetical protein